MIRISCLALVLGITGCARMDRDPLAYYQGAAGSFEIPVTTFAGVPF